MASIAFEVNSKMENIGARRLQTIMAQLLDDLMFDVPDPARTSFTVDRTFVNERLAAIIRDEDLSRYIL